MRTIGLLGIIPWCYFISLIYDHVNIRRSVVVCGAEKQRVKYSFAIFAFLPIILWAGFREGHGYVDTNSYIDFYNSLPLSFARFKHYITDVYSEDPGFTIYMWLFKRVYGNNYHPFIFFTSLFQCLGVAFFFRKYSPNYSITLFLFVASLSFFSWIFNGLRQFMAVVIILLSIRFLLEEKRYILYGLIVILASTFHQSAIIMLPIGFISTGKPWNKRTNLSIIAAVFAVVATGTFTSLLDSALVNTQYSNNMSNAVQMGDDGTNPIRVLVNVVPTIIAFWGKQKLEDQEDNVLNISVNMSIISTSLWVISAVTNGISIGRLPIYVNLFNFILLPYEIEILFEKSSRKLFCNIMKVMYILYYFYQLHFTWRII